MLAPPAPRALSALTAPWRTLASALTAPWRTLVLLVLATLGDLAFDPLHRHVPLCPFRGLTGWDCPLCGGLRAVEHLAHGDVAAALHANVLVVVGIPVFLLWWGDWTLRSRRGLPARAPSRGAVLALAAVAVAYTVVRNLPAFAALRP